MKKNIKGAIIFIISILILTLVVVIGVYIYSEYEYNKIIFNEEKERIELTNNYNILINQKLELLNVEVIWNWSQRKIQFDLKNNFDKNINWIVFWFVLEDIFWEKIFLSDSMSSYWKFKIINFQDTIKSWFSSNFSINWYFIKWYISWIVNNEKITLKWIEIQDIIFEDWERYNFEGQEIEIILKNNNN